ncbi:MAG: IS3 family transposase [Bacilli bacterium]|nr:IS3 family transposase [Bacilli bacterium]
MAKAESDGIYGSPKITAILSNNYYITYSYSKIAKAMHLLSIRSIVIKRLSPKKSRITDKEKSLMINLIKNLKITKINQVWTTDVTHINTINDGTFYLITYIDLFSKKVISLGLYDDQKTDKLINTLKIAISNKKYSPGLICHSDKGSQMSSNSYRQFLKDHNFVFSYTSLNHSCDKNATQESFHSLLKKEKLYQINLYTYEDDYNEVFEYIEEFYNPIRIHSSIGIYLLIILNNYIKIANTLYKKCLKG